MYQANAEKERISRFGASSDGIAIFGLIVAAILSWSGCGGAPSTNPNSGLSSTNAQAQVNSYLGTAGAQDPGGNPVTSSNYPGGIWTATLNDAESQFSYRTASNFAPTGTLPVQGVTAAANGYLALTQTNEGPPKAVGYALEIRGRSALMRPKGFSKDSASSSDPLVVLVQQSGCLQLGSGGTTFQYVTLPGSTWNPATERAYGTVLAVSNGNTWSFVRLNERTLAGSAVSTPALQDGLCNGGALGFAINIPSDTANKIPPTTIEVGPTGFLIADQGTAADPKGGLPARVGMMQPSAPVDTSAAVAIKYLGFFFEPAEAKATQLVAFGRTAPSGRTMSGGIFPNDDPLQIPANDIAISLNAQDPNNNGLYPSATVTRPDPGNCTLHGGTSGADANGNTTCTMPAVAIVGISESKYALFLISRDLTSGVASSPMGIFLYQQ